MIFSLKDKSIEEAAFHLKRFINNLKKWWFLIFIVYLTIVFIKIWQFEGYFIRDINIVNINIVNSNSILVFVELMALLKNAYIISFSISIFIIIIWLLIFLNLFHFIKIINGVVFQLLFKFDNKFYRSNYKYNKFINSKNKLSNIIIILSILIPIPIFLKLKIYLLSPLSVINIYLIIISIICPLIVIILCTNLILIGIKRKKKNNYRFLNSLFSRNSIIYGFKSFTDFLFFIAFSIKIWVPLLFVVLFLIGDKGQLYLNSNYKYKEKWHYLIENGYTKDKLINKHELIRPDKISEFLCTFKKYKNDKTLLISISKIKEKVFLIVILIGVLYMSFKIIGSYSFLIDFRNIIMRITIITVKTTIITIIYQFIIKNIFSVKTIGLINLETIFMFIFTLILTFDSLKIVSNKKL